MNASQKMLAMGVGAIIGGVLIAFGILIHIFPDRNKAKRLWAIAIPSFVVGIALTLVGIAIR